MEDWKAALEEVLAERRQHLGEPPSQDELIALRAGELSGEERAHLLERASVDPAVARELLDVLRFPEPVEDDEPADEDDAVAERWQVLRERMVAEGDLPREGSGDSIGDPMMRRWLPLAAVFLLGIATAWGVGWWWSPAPRFDAGPAVNLPIVELLPEEAGGPPSRGSATVVTLPREAEGVVLTLAPPVPPTGAGYTLELVRGDAVVRTLDGLAPGPGGVFVVVFPREDWAVGRHRLHLRDDAGQPVASFELEVDLPR